MSKVDDELIRRFHRAERPVGSDDLFEGLARRRRSRRTLQRVQAGALAVSVLVATAVGFVALQRAFDEDRRDVGTPLPGNGEIVFSRIGDDGRFHLYAAQPDGSGVRQITDDATNDTDPAVSPDGRTIAYTRGSDGGSVVATVPIEGGDVSWQTSDLVPAADPSWSPDGTQLVYIASGIDSSLLYVVRVNGGTPRCICFGFERSESTGPALADPSWAPDGSRVAFAFGPVDAVAGRAATWDIGLIDVEGTEMDPLVASERDDEAPAWSPDGTRIAFTRPGEQGDEVWTVAPDGTEETLVATAVEASLEPDLAWAPDGSALLVSDRLWIYRVDVTPEGDPRENFVQLVRGGSPSWQPLPTGLEPSVTASPEPSVSPSPEPEGKDIGLGFNLCNVERLGGIDFLGDGTNGQAWTGTRAKGTGQCPDQDAFRTYLVAADVDGDGAADSVSETLPDCFYCHPFDAADLDADGDDELVVLWSEGSTPSFMIYAIAHGEIAPVLVAEPGHPEAREERGQPLTFATGGDEGYSGWVRCENFPDAPVLIVTWRDHPIEGNTMEVHETRFVLQDDGMFHVVGSTDYSAPVGDPIPGVSDEPACGVDFQLFG